LLEHLLLEKIAHRKLVLYQILENLPPGTYTVNTIENECEYAYHRVKSLLHEIHNDLQDLSRNNYHLLVENGRINITKELASYTSYQQFLLKNSLPYQFILHSLLEPKDKLQDFCDKHFVSAASVTRTLKPLQAYLRKYNLKLNINQLEFQGEEPIIRMALCNFLWLNCQGQSIEQIFKESEAFSSLATQLVQFAPKKDRYVAEKRIRMILSVTLLRIQAQNYIELTNNLSWFMELPPSVLKACIKQPITEETLHHELQFLALLCFNGPFYSSVADPFTQKALSVIETGDCGLVQFIKEFESYYLNRFVAASETEHNDILRVNLLCIAANYFLFHQRIPSLFTMVHSALLEESILFRELFTKINRFLIQFAKRQGFTWLEQVTSDIAIIYAHLLLPRYELFNTNQHLKIGLFLDSNYLLTQPLLNFLYGLSFLELIYHQNDQIVDYDFIITTSIFLVPKEANCKQFVYNFSKSDSALIDLYQLLKEEYDRKNAAILNQPIQAVQ
jgi:hypothetical protein